MKNHYLRSWVLFILTVLLTGLVSGIVSAEPTLILTCTPMSATSNSVWTFEATWVGGLDAESKPIWPSSSSNPADETAEPGIVFLQGLGTSLEGYDGIPMYAVPGSVDVFTGTARYRVSVSAGLNMSNPKQWPQQYLVDDPAATPETFAPDPTDPETFFPTKVDSRNNLIWDPFDKPMWYAPRLVPSTPMPAARAVAYFFKKTETPAAAPDPMTGALSDTEITPLDATLIGSVDGVYTEAAMTNALASATWNAGTSKIDISPADALLVTANKVWIKYTPAVTPPPVITNTPVPTPSPYITLTVSGSSAGGMIDYGSDNGTDSLRTYPQSDRLTGLPLGLAVDPLDVGPIQDRDGTRPDDGSGSHSYAFKVKYYGNQPLNWGHGSGVVLYLRNKKTNPAGPFTPLAMDGDVVETMGDIGINYYTIRPGASWAYNSLDIGIYEYYFGASDDYLSWALRNQPLQSAWGGPNPLDPFTARNVAGYPAISRAAGMRYSDGVTDRDSTLYIDRCIKAPGYFEGTNSYPYKSTEHPRVSCALTVDTSDSLGVSMADGAKYGGGRFYGTLWPYKRCVNPTLPGAVSYSSFLSENRSEFSGATSSDEVEFRIKYRQLDSLPPKYIKVWIYNSSTRPSGTALCTSYTMTKDVNSNNYFSGVWYRFKTKLPAGPHTYYFEASDGETKVIWPRRPDLINGIFDGAVPTMSTEAEWSSAGYDNNDYCPGPYVNSAPVMSNWSVTPTSGKMGETYKFRVKYSDPDGQRPYTTYLHFLTRDGETPQRIQMTPEVFLDPSVDNRQLFKDGVYYSFDTSTLQDSALQSGTRRFYFEFSDDWGRQYDVNDRISGETVIKTSDGKQWKDGPTITAPVAPRLIQGKVESDGTSNSATLWKFGATYISKNNNAPQMLQVYLGVMQPDGKTILWDKGNDLLPADPADKVYSDGAVYYYQTRLTGIDFNGDPSKRYYYAFVAYDGVTWAEYNDGVSDPTKKSEAASVVRNQDITETMSGRSFTIVPPIANSPIMGPLAVELPGTLGQITDAQISVGGTIATVDGFSQLFGGTLASIDDQKSGWRGEEERYSVMRGSAINSDRTPSISTVMPDDLNLIASVEGVYTTIDANGVPTGTNYYELVQSMTGVTGVLGSMTGLVDVEGSMTGVVDATGLLITPDADTDPIATIVGVYTDEAMSTPIASAGQLNGDGQIEITDPADIQTEGAVVYIKYINGLLITPEDPTLISSVVGVYTDEAMTVPIASAEATLNVDGQIVISDIADKQLDGTTVYIKYSNDLLITPDSTSNLARVLGVYTDEAMTLPIVSAGQLNADNVILISDAAEILPNGTTVYIKYSKFGYSLSDPLISLTTNLPADYLDSAKIVYIKYHDYRFTHQIRGSATDAAGTSSDITHFTPDGGYAASIKNNSADVTGGLLGVWEDKYQSSMNYFNPFMRLYTDDPVFNVELTTNVPAGTSALYGRYYQKGDYNIDRWSGNGTFLSDVAANVFATYVFGTKMPSDIAANTPPVLTFGKVKQYMGARTSTYVYSVIYKDEDGPNGQAPEYVRVYIDGVPFNMTPEATGGSPIYRIGVVYTYTTTNLTGGSHKFRFDTSDGAAASLYDWYSDAPDRVRPTSGVDTLKDIDGPWVNDPPMLTLGSATPNPAAPGTVGTRQTVDYSVVYTDLDNEPPFMFDVTRGDAVGQSIIGLPRLWVDYTTAADSYTAGKVASFTYDVNYEPTKARTIVVKAIDNTTPVWTINQFKGKLMQITNGTLDGRVFLIQSNTANALTIATNDLLTDGFVIGTTFRINGIVMSKFNAEEQDFTKGIKYVITVPKLAVGAHKFRFNTRGRLVIPDWLPDQIMTGVVGATGMLITPNAPLRMNAVTGVFTDSVCQASVASAVTGLLNAQSQIVIGNVVDKLPAGSIVYIKYTMAPFTDEVRDPVTGDHTGPTVVLEPPVGNEPPVLGGEQVLSGPFGKKADSTSRTSVMLNTDDTTGDWTVIEADSVRYIMGVYLNATLDANSSVSDHNYLAAPVMGSSLPSDYTFTCDMLPVVADGTNMVQIGKPEGTSLLRVVPDAPSVIASVTGVYLNSALTGTNYYGSIVGGKVVMSQQLPSGTQHVYILYKKAAGSLPVYIKYLRAKPASPAKFPFGDPLTLRINYNDLDGDAPTMHDGVQGYLNLVMGNPAVITPMVGVPPIVGNYTIPKPFAWAFMAASAGVSKFHFVASDGYDLADPLTTHAVRYPALAANDFSFEVNSKPVLIGGIVSPSALNPATHVVFKVQYTDSDGAGTTPNVRVRLYKATPAPVEYVYSMTTTGTDFAAGVDYILTMPSNGVPMLPDGKYSVIFEASDGTQYGIPYTLNATDIPSRNVAPIIKSANVAPRAGKLATKFVYQAYYRDADNQAPVGTISGQKFEGLLLVIDKGTSIERQVKMTKSALAPVNPDYTIAGGVLFETVPGITMNQFGSIAHSYEVQASDGISSAVPVGESNVPVHLVPRFDKMRVVSATATTPDTAAGITTASVGDNVLIVGLIKFPKNSVYPMPTTGAQLSIKVSRPDGNTILLGGYVTMQPEGTDPIYWIGKIKVTEYTKGADAALVTGVNLTLSDSGEWKIGAARLSDVVWDAVETDIVIDGVNDGFKVSVGGPMRAMHVSDPTNPATSAPIVDMITPAMVIADGDVGRIFGYDWAAKMQIVRWDPTTNLYSRYGNGNFPQLNPGESVWIKPLLTYSPETATQASIDTGLLTAPAGIQLLGNRQYRTIHAFSKAYPTQMNTTTNLMELSPCVIPLYGGWNQFGNIFINWKKDTTGKPLSPRQDIGIPFSELRVRYLNQELSIADAAMAGWIRDYAYRFDAPTRKYVLVNATEPGAERALKSWSGFWIRAFVDCDLVINPNTTYNGSVVAPASLSSLSGASRRKFDTPPAMPAAD